MVSGLSGGRRSNHELGILLLGSWPAMLCSIFPGGILSFSAWPLSLHGQLLHTQGPRYRKRKKLTPAHWGLGGGRANFQESTCSVTDTGTHWTHSTSYNFFSGCLAILIRTSPATVFQWDQSWVWGRLRVDRVCRFCAREDNDNAALRGKGRSPGCLQSGDPRHRCLYNMSHFQSSGIQLCRPRSSKSKAIALRLI